MSYRGRHRAFLPTRKLGVGMLCLAIASCSASTSPDLYSDAREVGAPPVGQLDPSNTLKPNFASASGGPSHYKVGVGDVLQITVFQVQDLNRKVQVAGNGTLTLPLIGQVKAAGRTAQEVESEIASRLQAKYLRSPQVTVYIEEFNSQKVTVGGAVKKPGILPLKGDMSLLQAISAAEGFDTVADPSNVVIFRTRDSERFVARFNVDQIRAGAARDPLLENGDVVLVDASGVRTALRDWSPAISGLGSTAAFVSVLK